MSEEKVLRWAINIAALIVLMDLSAVNIALPEMRIYFNTTVTGISLVLMFSMLSATSSALIMGKISQVVSSKKLLILGFIVFGSTTLLSGFIRDYNLLLFVRFIQGFAEAALYVIGPALIKHHLAPDKQARAYGEWMMSSGIGICLGPLVGGYLIGLSSWASVFFINVPFAILGLLFSLQLKLKKQEAKKEFFDILGAILSFVFLESIIAAVNMGKETGWKGGSEWLLLVISILSFTGFLYREKKFKFPILQLNLFRVRNFWLASFGFFLFFTINVGSRFLRPFYFEEGRGFSTEMSGWLMVVSPAVMVLLSPFTEYFQSFWGTRMVVIAGNFFLFISMLMFAFWDQNTSISFLVFSTLMLGVGMGFYYSAATTVGMLALPRINYGMGSATIATSKSMGKLVGVLVFALLFNFFLNKINPVMETTNVLERMQSIQNVFRFAAGLSFIALLFSFFFQK